MPNGLPTDADAVTAAGAFSVVLEKIPEPLARRITSAITDSHHRDRRLIRLRRTDSRHRRHSGYLHRIFSQIRQTLCRTRDQGRRSDCQPMPPTFANGAFRRPSTSIPIRRGTKRADGMQSPARSAHFARRSQSGKSTAKKSPSCRRWAPCTRHILRWCGTQSRAPSARS